MDRSTTASEKWRRMVDEQAASGQTVAVFSRERGLSASSLFAWRRRLRSARPSAAFVEARISAGDSDGRGGAIEIICDGGRRISVRRDFDPEALQQVIAALEGKSSKPEALA